MKTLNVKKMNKPYDSTADTLRHIKRVADLLGQAAQVFIQRGTVHDESKLHPPEKEIFDTYTPKLRETTYGSEEYKKYLLEMEVALEHHYAENSHHPEHYPRGINGMNLFDLTEMLMDWKAATERHEDGDIWESLKKNKERFHINQQTYQILCNTATYMGW